jgi:hypothetical protein
MCLLNNAKDTSSPVLSRAGAAVAGLPVPVKNMWNAAEEVVNDRHYI